jgi:phytoene desaturase
MNDVLPDPPHAAVIGSGFGGLAIAIRLLASGFKVTLFEARDKPGGRAYVYENQGFVFDAGPTVITAPHCIEELYAVAGRRMQDSIELLPVQPLYRLLWDDGDRFEYVGDGAQFLEQVRQRNPEDVQGYLRFCDYAKQVFEAGYEHLVAQPFLSFADMVRVAPALIRLRADRSVYRSVARFVKNEHLRQALSFHTLLVGGNPFSTSSIYTLVHHLERKWGVFFPRGGTGRLVQALVQLIRDLGGELRLEAKVSNVDVEQRNGRTIHFVHTEKSGREPFDLVVSNADVHHTYASLYGAVPAAQATTKRLERQDWSMSLFVLYFGTDRKYDDLAHHSILFATRYRESLREIFGGPELSSDFSLCLHAPCVTDDSLAPPGCGTYYVLSPVPHLGHTQVKWDSFGERYADKIIVALERTMPELRKHVVVKSWFTPEDFKNQLAAFNGSAFSLSPTLMQSAWFRPHNRDPKISGLYIAGAGTHPGAGMPGVINSAKATAAVIQQDFSR